MGDCQMLSLEGRGSCVLEFGGKGPPHAAWGDATSYTRRRATFRISQFYLAFPRCAGGSLNVPQRREERPGRVRKQRSVMRLLAYDGCSRNPIGAGVCMAKSIRGPDDLYDQTW